jgi:hypothetical protein
MLALQKIKFWDDSALKLARAVSAALAASSGELDTLD